MKIFLTQFKHGKDLYEVTLHSSLAEDTLDPNQIEAIKDLGTRIFSAYSQSACQVCRITADGIQNLEDDGESLIDKRPTTIASNSGHLSREEAFAQIEDWIRKGAKPQESILRRSTSPVTTRSTAPQPVSSTPSLEGEISSTQIIVDTVERSDSRGPSPLTAAVRSPSSLSNELELSAPVATTAAAVDTAANPARLAECALRGTGYQSKVALYWKAKRAAIQEHYHNPLAQGLYRVGIRIQEWSSRLFPILGAPQKETRDDQEQKKRASLFKDSVKALSQASQKVKVTPRNQAVDEKDAQVHQQFEDASKKVFWLLQEWISSENLNFKEAFEVFYVAYKEQRVKLHEGSVYQVPVGDGTYAPSAVDFSYNHFLLHAYEELENALASISPDRISQEEFTSYIQRMHALVTLMKTNPAWNKEFPSLKAEDVHLEDLKKKNMKNYFKTWKERSPQFLEATEVQDADFLSQLKALEDDRTSIMSMEA